MLELVSELRLGEVLRRVVRTASHLVDASDGVLAVLDTEDRVVEWVAPDAGYVSPELSWLLSEPATLGLRRRPGVGPDDHPAALALAVPVRSRRGFRANVYLAGKRGGAEFTEGDEALLVSFASVASAVIDNAKLYEEGQQRELWVALQGEIATSLLAGTSIDDVLDLVARGARELTDADASTVLLSEGPTLRIAAADGQRVRALIGRGIDAANTISGAVVATGEPVLLADGGSTEATGEPLLSVGPVGRAIFVPLVANGSSVGTLAVGRLTGKAPLTQTDFWLIESFASQVSMALDYGRARAELERLAVVEDQERIARDLHDNVIQQLFATGMSLQGTARRMTDQVAADRVQKAVDILDNVIREIRSAVFALGTPVERSGGLRESLRALTSELFESSGTAARLHFYGPVDAAIGADVQQHVVATVREALSNVSRHAAASQVDVHLHVGSEIVLRVIDDGVGIGSRGAPRGGLLNLRARARALGGNMVVAAPASGGTTLEWRVPLDHHPQG